MFYNTLNETGDDLKASKRKAKRQELRVLELFQALPRKELTPAEAFAMLINFGWINNGTPLTSIRRAITRLTEEGKLEKTTITRPGDYGKINYCWRLARPRQGELFDAQTNTDYGESS